MLSDLSAFAYWAVKTGFFGKLEKKLGTNLAEKVAVAWSTDSEYWANKHLEETENVRTNDKTKTKTI